MTAHGTIPFLSMAQEQVTAPHAEPQKEAGVIFLRLQTEQIWIWFSGNSEHPAVSW